MERQLAVVTAEHAYLRSGAGETDGSNQTGIEDEIFSAGPWRFSRRTRRKPL